MSDNRTLERIGKLLRQAEGKGVTEEEAALFMRKAQMLATNSQVDLAVARRAIAKKEDREQPIQKTVTWGDMGTKNTKKHLVNLFSSVAAANDVKLNIYRDSSGVICFGFPSDIEVVETLFASLAIQMVEAGNAYIRKGEYKQEMTYRETRVRNSWGYMETRTIEAPIDGRTARANFYEGFDSKVRMRMNAARREAAAVEVDVQVADEVGDLVVEHSTGALVLAEKAVEVRDFYQRTSRARGSWKGSSSSSFSSSARSAGVAAGASARLSSQTAIGGGRTAISV